MGTSAASNDGRRPRAVELWQHEGVLALHETGTDFAWIGVQSRGRHLCLDARRLVQGLDPDPSDPSNRLSWASLQVLISRPSGPRVVAVWRAPSLWSGGKTKLTRSPVGGRPSSSDPLAQWASLPDRVALQYLSPTSNLPSHLLTLEGMFTRPEMEMVIGCSRSHSTHLLARHRNGHHEELFSKAGKFGSQLAFTPLHVFEYAASEHRPGLRTHPGSRLQDRPLSPEAQAALAVLRAHGSCRLGKRTSEADATVHVISAHGLQRRGVVVIDRGRARLLPGAETAGSE